MVMPRAAGYAHPEDAVIQSWRGGARPVPGDSPARASTVPCATCAGGRWFTQQWQATQYIAENSTLMFDPRTGSQGGEGMTNSGQWWVENVLEECDDAREPAS